MILRRIIEHLKSQDWTAVAIDFVIVVAGVFVGLQVQEWHAARGHRTAEIGYLNAMEEDVEYSIGSLEKLLVDMQRQQAAHAALYRYSTDPAAVIARGPVSDESEVTYLFSGPLLIADFDMAGVFRQPRADGS